VTTDDKTRIPEPTPFEKFETLTKRLLGVPKKEITEKARRQKKAPRIAKGSSRNKCRNFAEIAAVWSRGMPKHCNTYSVMGPKGR